MPQMALLILGGVAVLLLAWVVDLGGLALRLVRSPRAVVRKINRLERKLEQEIGARSTEAEKIQALREKTKAFRDQIRAHVEAHPKLPPEQAEAQMLDRLLPEAFAVVREAAKLTRGERHYDEQLLGGIVLHQGKIAEMKTGEGKTLTLVLPAYLNALTGRGVHIVTANDHLARRDANNMGAIFDALGLTIGAIQSDETEAFVYDGTAQGVQRDPNFTSLKRLDADDRKQAYDADITYGTTAAFGFDYERANRASSPEEQVYQEAHYAIVDEVDHGLLDEAPTHRCWLSALMRQRTFALR
jgi:preprotein translocase subunit SecA